MKYIIRFLRALPRALELEYLRWARREINPQHADVGYIIQRIRELES